MSLMTTEGYFSSFLHNLKQTKVVSPHLCCCFFQVGILSHNMRKPDFNIYGEQMHRLAVLLSRLLTIF